MLTVWEVVRYPVNERWFISAGKLRLMLWGKMILEQLQKGSIMICL